jgi:hypothetical protein
MPKKGTKNIIPKSIPQNIPLSPSAVAMANSFGACAWTKSYPGKAASRYWTLGQSEVARESALSNA